MGHVSLGHARLGAGASRMAKKVNKRRDKATRTLSVRLPHERADRLQASAAAAGVSAATYIARRLGGSVLDSRPDIAALACLMRIAAAAADRSQSSGLRTEDAAGAAAPMLTDAQVQRMIDALCGSVAAHIDTHDIPDLEELDDEAGTP